MRIVGTREGGGKVAESDGIMYLLTECCEASGKGSIADGMDGSVVCRECYQQVSGDYGDCGDTRDPAHLQSFIDAYRITLFKENEMTENETTATVTDAVAEVAAEIEANAKIAESKIAETHAIRINETEARKALGMSRRQLSEELGWTESRVWYLEQESMDHSAERNIVDLKLMAAKIVELTKAGWAKPTIRRLPGTAVVTADTKEIVAKAVADALDVQRRQFAEALGVISDITTMRMDEAKAKKSSTKPFQTILDAISSLQWSEG
jgi:transcriptional regulator with XRE-family HTH domain